MRRRRTTARSVLVLVAVALVAAGATDATARPRPLPVAASAWGHLEEVLERSPAPEYRRYGSHGMAGVARYARRVLDQAGYATVELRTPADRWRVDYAPGSEPLLERVDDGLRFLTESGFALGATTGPAGITCVVRRYDQVQPGECGYVPFAVASPEWKNILAEGARSAVQTIVARGGVGAVIEGDTARSATIALRLALPIPSVVAVAAEPDVVGRVVRLRAMGGWEPATTHDVVGVRRPTVPGRGYVVLLAHADGWFAAAADNGSGTAAALRAAQLLATAAPVGAGVLVALVDGEEVGYIGVQGLMQALESPAGLALPGGAVRIDEIESVVNLDAPSARASDVGLPTPFSWRVLVHTADALAVQGAALFTAGGVLGLPLEASIANGINGGLDRTDARYFAARGIPVVWPVTGYPEYHTSADTLAAVDPVDLELVATAAATVVRSFGA
ncbi:MAG: M28 family peptidase [Acidimicrobiia bacterium]|nr:M28 family peptidase [Acidimicrobiia bacterium]